jgi:RNA polymerase sigma factor (sigma-70 family)
MDGNRTSSIVVEFLPIVSYSPSPHRSTLWWIACMGHQDRRLAREVLDGDPEAVGLVVRWITEVLTWPRFWSLRKDGSDLVQESLARVVESLQFGRFDSAKDLRSYVLGIARHTAIQSLQESIRRRDRRDDVPIEDLPIEDIPSSIDPVAHHDLVSRIMEGASVDCRRLIELRFLQEKRYEEIAAELMLPVGTIKSRLSRCLDCTHRALRIAGRRRVQAPSQTGSETF